MPHSFFNLEHVVDAKKKKMRQREDIFISLDQDVQ